MENHESCILYSTFEFDAIFLISEYCCDHQVLRECVHTVSACKTNEQLQATTQGNSVCSVIQM